MGARTNIIAFRTILVKEILRFSRIWIQTILPPAITMALYLIIFGGFIGSRVGEMDGIRYMDYIIPGVIMMAVIQNAYSNVVSSFFGSKFQRHIEELLIAPIPSYVILAGYVAGGVARGLVVGIVVTLVSMLFGDLEVHSVAVTLGVVLLTAVLFALAGLINGIYAKSFDDISIIPIFVLTPLTYLGGIFYSIHLLPAFWQNASLLNPILYMVNAFRYGFLGVADIPLAPAFGIILAFIAGLFGFALYLLERGIGLKA